MDTIKKEEGSSIEGSSGEERDVEEIMIYEALKILAIFFLFVARALE